MTRTRTAARAAAAAVSGGSPADVVIVGAGIMGLSIAHQVGGGGVRPSLKRETPYAPHVQISRRAPELQLTVLEAQRGLGHGSTGYSTGFQRAYYSNDETMRFARCGINAYRNWGDYTGLGSQTQVTFTETGALWMLGGSRSDYHEMSQRLAAVGVRSHVLDERGVANAFPLLSTEPFPHLTEAGEVEERDYGSLAALHEEGAGHVDPARCLDELLMVCRKAGVDVRFACPVVGFSLTETETETENGKKQLKVKAVELADGEVLECGLAAINAAGPWAPGLAQAAGLELPATLEAVRVLVAHKWVDKDFLSLPFVADGWGDSGIYFMPRAANSQLVVGSIGGARFESEVVRDPGQLSPALDPDIKQEFLYRLHHRLPSLPPRGEVSGFSHMYTVNREDCHPLIGETKVSGLWVCMGFSGHGLKLAPAVGSLVAQQVTGRRLPGDPWESDTPLDFFGPYRSPLTVAAKNVFA